MALIVEDGTVVSGAESYISVADADTYWAKRNNSTWASASTTEKEAALRHACKYLDQQYSWIGSRIEAFQPLNWPRVLDIPQSTSWLNIEVLVEGIYTVPTALKDAQCELALEALGASLAPSLERGGLISSERVGSIAVTYAPGAPANKRYPFVDLLVKQISTGRYLGGVSHSSVRG